MQEVRVKPDKPSQRSVTPVITIRDRTKDGNRSFEVDRPMHAAVAPACLRLPQGVGLWGAFANLFRLHARTPDENLATQEIAAIKLRARAETELKDKLTHLRAAEQSAVGTWVTHEEIDALETRQLRLVSLIDRLRRERTLITLFALLIVGAALLAHVSVNEPQKPFAGPPADPVRSSLVPPAPIEPAAAPQPSTVAIRAATPAVEAILAGSESVIDYDSFASPVIEPLASNIQGNAPDSGQTTKTHSTIAGQPVGPLPDIDNDSPAIHLSGTEGENLATPETPQARVNRLTREWQSAWQNQDALLYLSYYGESFTPPRGLSRQAWEIQRFERITKPRSIEIMLSDVRVMPHTSGLELRFTQLYRSDSYSDQTAKRLIWSRQGTDWKIIRENTLSE